LITNARQHLYSADYIRAIASLMVAIFHLGGKALPILNYGWLGVELFFVLSGFIICWSLPIDYNFRHTGAFIRKRLVRIEPPYLVSILLILIINKIFLHQTKIDWKNLLMHLGYINNFWNEPYLNPVYWTLGIEFQYYILIALIFPLLLKKWGAFFIVLLTALFSVLPVTEGLIVAVFPLFSMGILSYFYKKQRLNFKVFVSLLTIVFIISIFSLGILKSLTGLVAVSILSSEKLIKNKVISFLSNISFSLYLTHDIIGSRVVVYIGTLMPKTLFWKGLIFASGIFLSIAVAYGFYLLIEKPFIKLSKKIHYAI